MFSKAKPIWIEDLFWVWFPNCSRISP